MDRPLGSKNPKLNFIYSLNYGFIPNITSGDGDEIDVYIIG
ncbi:inorganic diphosphatase [Clostridium perfringens]